MFGSQGTFKVKKIGRKVEGKKQMKENKNRIKLNGVVFSRPIS